MSPRKAPNAVPSTFGEACPTRCERISRVCPSRSLAEMRVSTPSWLMWTHSCARPICSTRPSPLPPYHMPWATPKRCRSNTTVSSHASSVNGRSRRRSTTMCVAVCVSDCAAVRRPVCTSSAAARRCFGSRPTSVPSASRSARVRPWWRASCRLRLFLLPRRGAADDGLDFLFRKDAVGHRASGSLSAAL